MTDLYREGVADVRYTPTRSGRDRLVGDRFTLPTWITVEVDDPALDHLVEIDVDLRGPTPECTALVVMRREDGPPVTGEALRSVRLATYVREAVVDLGGYALHDHRGRLVGTGWPLAGDDAANYVRSRRREERRGRRRITDDDLRRVAQVYRAGLARREPPTRAVARELRLGSQARAARWVARARDAGALGPAPGRRVAGEADTPEAPPPTQAHRPPPTRSTVARPRRSDQ